MNFASKPCNVLTCFSADFGDLWRSSSLQSAVLAFIRAVWSGAKSAMIAKLARDGLASGGRGETKSAMIAKSARDGLACGGRGDPGYGSVAVLLTDHHNILVRRWL